MKRLHTALAVLGTGLFLIGAGAQAQPIKVGELNSYKVFTAFLDPYKKGWGTGSR